MGLGSPRVPGNAHICRTSFLGQSFRILPIVCSTWARGLSTLLVSHNVPNSPAPKSRIPCQELLECYRRPSGQLPPHWPLATGHYGEPRPGSGPRGGDTKERNYSTGCITTRPPSATSTYRLRASNSAMPTRGSAPTAPVSTYLGSPSQITVTPTTSRTRYNLPCGNQGWAWEWVLESG